MRFSFKFLVDAGLYESEEEALKREKVLGELGKVIFFSFTFNHSSYLLYELIKQIPMQISS